MQSHLDTAPHGYTVDADGNVWYWEAEPNTGGVTFRDSGYPTDHPYRRTGHVPAGVREHAEQYVAAMREQGELSQ